MKRILISLLVVALTLVAISPTFAQTAIDPRCVGLTSEEDCTTLTAGLDGLASAGSFNNQDFSLQLGGAGGTSTGNELTITGSGPMLVDETGSIMALDLIATSDPNAQPGQVIWLDNMLYLGTPDDTGNLTWTGTSTDSPEGDFLIQLLSGNLLLNALKTPGVAATQRLDDAEADGQAMQVFQSNIDLVSLLLTPEMLTALQALLQSLPEDATVGGRSGGNFGDMGQADLAGAIPLLSLLFTKDTIQVVVWVGAEDGLVHHVEMLIDWVIDPSMIDPTQSEATFQFNLVTNLDQQGELVEIVAPENFEVADDALDLGNIPLDSIFGSGGSSTTPAEQFLVEDPIVYGESVSGTLTDDNPYDVWGFEADAGDIVTITLAAAHPDSVLDTRLQLLDADGVELTSNDDHGTDNSDLLFSDAMIQNFEIPADGEYRIVATWLAPVTDGAYTLSLTQVQ